MVTGSRDTSTPIYFDVAAAQNALARADEGVDLLPGDGELIDIYERYCQQEQLRFDDQCRRAEQERWLADQCPSHVEGGGGDVCDDCGEDEE